MKRLALMLFLMTALLSACAAETVVGPGESDRSLLPAEEDCNRNVQFC